MAGFLLEAACDMATNMREQNEGLQKLADKIHMAQTPKGMPPVMTDAKTPPFMRDHIIRRAQYEFVLQQKHGDDWKKHDVASKILRKK